jgi:diacylglycerol kinase family enzyme
MSTGAASVSFRRQIAGVVALVAGLALVVAVVVVVVDNALSIVLALVALFVMVAGAWWVATEQFPRRAVGAAATLLGIALLVVAIVHAHNDTGQFLWRSAVVIGLLIIAAGSARVAMAPELHVLDTGAQISRPQHPVLLCNPWSGGGKVDRFGLVALASELGVETVMLDRGLDLEQLARDAVARGADCLGMAGGDGSQALVASIAVEHGLPFVCVSAGTRNHFALDLGLNRENPRESMYAFRDAVTRKVDYATVNGRFFVNNVSLGVYAKIVQEDSYRDAKVDTTMTLLPEMLNRQAEPFDLQFTTPDGEAVDGAIVVMVSNNPYVIGASPDNAQRRHLDRGTLGVFAITTRTGAEAGRLLAVSAVGQHARSRFWTEFEAPTFELRSHSGKAYAGVDGEALELPTPLRFETHPRGLTLLVPEGNLEAAERRRAHRVSVRDLVTIASGNDPLPA